MKKTLSTLTALIVAISFNAQVIRTDTTIAIDYLSNQSVYLDIDNDVDNLHDIIITNENSDYNRIQVNASGHILSINNNEIVKECQGFLDHTFEWQNPYAYVRQENITEVTEGYYSVPFRLERLDATDNQLKYKYGYLKMIIEDDLDMVIKGWYINNTWNEGIDCENFFVSIDEKSPTKGKGICIYYDLSGRVLDKNNLPLNQIVIKAYDNGFREKVINTYNY